MDMENVAQFGVLNYCVLGAYMAAMFAVGLTLSGKQKTTKDYFLAGQRMPWLIVSMSIFASVTSAISYMGIPGGAYKENIALIVAGLVSVVVAPLLVLLFYPFYRKLNVTTSYQYIDRRFGRAARFATSGLFVCARLGWLGVVIYAPAMALSVVTGVNIWLAIFLMGALAVGYTVLGGLSAVLWTDFLQFIFLVGGAIWVAVTLINNVPDGLTGIMTIASETGRLHVMDWKIDLLAMTGPIVIISYFFTFMQDYGTDQVTVQRLMAIPDFKGMAKAAILNGFFDLFIICLLVFVGLGMFAYYQHFPELLAEGIGGDKVLPFYMMRTLPAGISGLVITAIFAAAMSSMDSGINSLATVIVNDFVKPLRNKVRSELDDVKLARILTLVLGALGIAIACYAKTLENILQASQTFLGLFAGPILAMFLLGIFTRRGNFWGWLVGTLVALPATMVMQNCHKWIEGCPKVHWIYYFPFCFGVSLILGYVASLMIPCKKAPAELTLWGRSELKSEAQTAQ